MRISVRKGDPGYRKDHHRFRIILNGEDITKFCHTADEEEGRAYGYAQNDQGQFYIDPATEQPVEHVLFGNIRIIELVNGSRYVAKSS